MQQVWDSSAYARNARFVSELAGSPVETLNPQAGETILDLGCGDGFLTRRITESGAKVVGIDSSPEMVGRRSGARHRRLPRRRRKLEL